MPDDPRDWKLADKEKKKTGERADPVRQCSECFFVARPSPTCPNCGFVHPIASRDIDEVDGELREIQATQQRKQARQDQGRAQTKDDLIAIGRGKGMKNPAGWAAHVIRSRQAKRANA
jgi:hypothetical protein